MRVLLCNWRDLAHPAAGGAEVYTHEVLKRWAERGIDPVWFSAAVDGQPSREVVDGITIVRSGTRHSVYSRARAYYEAQGKGAFDLIIDEVNTRPFLCHQWAGDTPVVALIHQVAREVWFQELPLPVAMAGRYILEPYWLRQLRRVPTMTLSASSRQSLLDYGIQKVAVVPVGIASDALGDSLVKSDRLTLVFVGRLARNKRPDHAVAAHAMIRRRIPNAELFVIGSGVMLNELRAKAAPGVTFLGRVDQRFKDEVVSEAHALLVTSVREGWALVVDEAAALGTPAFGYDVAGLRDSVPQATGTLVEPRPEALAEAVIAAAPELLGNRRRAAWQGGAVTWDDVADRVLERALAIAEVTPGQPPLSVPSPVPKRLRGRTRSSADRRTRELTTTGGTP